MKVEFGSFDKEAVGVSIKFTLEIREWRKLAMELPANQPNCIRMKQYIVQMLSEKVDKPTQSKVIS